MRLFLTGATGFVGLNVLLEAVRIGRYEEIVCAVRDPGKLRRQMASERLPESGSLVRTIGWNERPPAEVDHAVHCAGILFARTREPYFQVNVTDTLRLLGSFPAATRVLALSSQSAGGPTPPGKPMRDRSDPDAPITWYGESKLAMEKALGETRPETRIWRPPMILGPRDRATLPLFQMAARPLRLKPGLHPKTYSWIAAGDLAKAILRAFDEPAGATPSAPLAACAPDSITDSQLIEAAAQVVGRRGWNLPIPHPIMRGISALVDRVPTLRAAVPSLTRDRAREIYPDRWVLDGAEFRARFAPCEFASLEDTLADTYAWYVQAGLLPAARAA